MNINEFESGWSEYFGPKLESVNKLFPAISYSAARYNGMLRVAFKASDDDTQFVLNCISYKLERESASRCESCGKQGLRRTNDDRLPYAQCLCTSCYALRLDEILTKISSE